MQFANPNHLYLLCLVPLLVIFYGWRWKRKQKALAQFAEKPLLRHLVVSTSRFRQIGKLVLLLGVVFSLALAISRPQWGTQLEMVRRQGIDLMIVLDASLSMDTRDVVPSRLEKAKHEIRSLLEKLHGDRTGLILFAGMPMVSCPLTIDQNALEMFLEIANTHMMPRPGTNIGEAIRLALRSFNSRERRTKLILLVTDGEDLEGEAAQAAEEARKAGVRIYALGVGTPSGEPVPLLDEQGNPTGYKKDESDGVVVSRLDQSLLMQVASLTGGKFQFATPGEEEIDRIAGEVSGMDRQQLESKFYLRRIDRFQVPLFLAILLLLWETISSDQIPKRSLLRRWGVLKIFLIGFFLFHFFPGSTMADQKMRRNAAGNRYFKEKNYDGALRKYVEAQDGKKYSQELSYNIANTLYQQKKYPEAIKEYEKALSSSHAEWNQRVFFNQGNAFFQSGDFSKAVDSYRKALELNPADQDAKHNLELALEKLQPQQNKNQPDNQNQKQQQKQNQQSQQKQDSGQEKKQDQKQDSRQNQKQTQGRDQKEQKPQQPRDSQPQSKQKEGMDPREAKRILEAFENQEKKEQRQQNRQLKQGTVAGKDW